VIAAIVLLLCRLLPLLGGVLTIAPAPTTTGTVDAAAPIESLGLQIRLPVILPPVIVEAHTAPLCHKLKKWDDSFWDC